MQQIADWLEKLGMLEYARLFAENRIDFSVLPDLTDQDLEKLGVVLGDRRKLLRAIANLLSNRAPEMGARHMVARRGRWPTLCEIPQSGYAKVCTIISLATAVAGPTRRGLRFSSIHATASKDRARLALLGGEAVSLNYFLFSAALENPSPPPESWRRAADGKLIH